MPPSDESTFLTVRAIAKDLEMTPKTVYQWIRDGDLRAVNVGSGKRTEYRVRKAEYELFLKARQVVQPSDTQEEAPPTP